MPYHNSVANAATELVNALGNKPAEAVFAVVARAVELLQQQENALYKVTEDLTVFPGLTEEARNAVDDRLDKLCAQRQALEGLWTPLEEAAAAERGL